MSVSSIWNWWCRMYVLTTIDLVLFDQPVAVCHWGLLQRYSFVGCIPFLVPDLHWWTFGFEMTGNLPTLVRQSRSSILVACCQWVTGQTLSLCILFLGRASFLPSDRYTPYILSSLYVNSQMQVVIDKQLLTSYVNCNFVLSIKG